jgi:hypothetical protein
MPEDHGTSDLSDKKAPRCPISSPIRACLECDKPPRFSAIEEAQLRANAHPDDLEAPRGRPMCTGSSYSGRRPQRALNGQPFDRLTAGGNSSALIPNMFTRLKKRVRDDNHTISDLPFKSNSLPINTWQ